jgi:hypothetical protein
MFCWPDSYCKDSLCIDYIYTGACLLSSICDVPGVDEILPLADVLLLAWLPPAVVLLPAALALLTMDDITPTNKLAVRKLVTSSIIASKLLVVLFLLFLLFV